MGWLASVLVWLGRRITVGELPGNLIAAGVCVLRGRGTIKTDGYGKVRKLTEEWCAAGYPVGLPAAGWYGSGEKLPLGSAAVTPARLVRASRRARGRCQGDKQFARHGVATKGAKTGPVEQRSRPLKRLFLPNFFSLENYPRAF